jgi:aspartyl-tRNA(Asn)/glutamyl-tRNA(Gln) amidotransferase subunit C
MLTIEEVKHIAHLARLELNNKELKQYSGELSKILGYVDQLRKVDTDLVAAQTDISGPVNVWRNDEARVWDKAETKLALKQVKSLDNSNQVKVERVLE